MKTGEIRKEIENLKAIKIRIIVEVQISLFHILKCEENSLTNKITKCIMPLEMSSQVYKILCLIRSNSSIS